MTEASRAVEVQGAEVERRDEAVRVRNGYAKRFGRPISDSFRTPCATPLTGIFWGFVLAQRWDAGLTSLLVAAALIAVRPLVTSVGVERLSAATGFLLYCAAACLLCVAVIGLEIQGVTRLVAGGLLVFLSFSTWLFSLLLVEPAVAWISRGVAGATLAAAVLFLCGSAASR